MASRVLGIDLGTINSCVSVVEDGKAIILGEGKDRTIPSVLAIKDGKEIVGHAARRQLVTNPQSTITAVKRLIGHSFDAPEVQEAIKRSPYPITASPLGTVMLEVGGRELTPVQVSAKFLEQIVARAIEVLGEPVSCAVISVPAHFTDVQRKATKLSAEYAGIEVLRLINEPTAAAFSYGYRKGEDFTLAVYDLGGGTFDVTVMCARGDEFEVIATDGDSYLGGEDFDQEIAKWLVSEFEAEHGVSLDDEGAQLRVREAAEKAKVELSSVEETTIDLQYLAQSDAGQLNLTRSLDRAKMAELTQGLMQRTLDLCARCLDEAGVDKTDIDEILLVGGQSRMPVVREAVRNYFNREPRRDINPDEVVAMGAALYGYSLCSDDLAETALDEAEDQYAIALKESGIARRLIDEIKLGKGQSDTKATKPLKSRLDELLAQTGEEGTATHGHAQESPLDEVRRSTKRLQSKVPALDNFDNLPTESHLEPRRVGDQELGAAVKDIHKDLEGLHAEAREVLDELANEIAEAEEDDARGPATPGGNRVIGAAAERLAGLIGNAVEATSEAASNIREAAEHASARKVHLSDVTSHSLGIAATGDLFSQLIAQNTKIPAESQQIFTTHQDGQREVSIRIHQGRNSKASENQLLGDFVLEGIAPAARMEPKIEVTFAIDENGILSVKARDKRSGVAQSIRIEDPLGLQAAEPQADRAEGEA